MNYGCVHLAGTYLKCRNVYLAYSVADGVSSGEETMEKTPDLCHTGTEYTDMSCVSCKWMIRYMWPVMTIMPMLFWWILQPAPKTSSN